MKILKFLLLFILFSLSHTTNRNILEDHYTTQKGINTSSDYDVVVISERKYYKNITFERKKPVVRPLHILDDDISNISQAVRPFNFIEISIQLTQNINHNTFHQFYESKNGLNTSITTPFYWGDIQASLHLLPYFGKEQSYLDFTGIHANLKWGKQFYLSDRLKWFNGGGIGWYIFYFSEEAEIAQIERELSKSYSSQLSYFAHKKISLNFAISKDIIFTYKKIDLVNISVGINYLTKTPGWMKLFLE
jgi:hypothetical protein